MNRARLTVAELLALKGTRQLSMLHLENLDEARAAAAAKVDLLSIETPIWSAAMRDAAGDCFVFVGLRYGPLATFDDYVRAAHDAVLLGGDAVYCAASLEIVSRLRAEGIPVCGHIAAFSEYAADVDTGRYPEATTSSGSPTTSSTCSSPPSTDGPTRPSVTRGLTPGQGAVISAVATGRPSRTDRQAARPAMRA